MLEKRDLKVGALVWWSRSSDRYAEWSCPCVVTQVSRKSFRVRSLDDFKETKDLRMDDAMDTTSRREMRPCNLEEVEEFFEKRKLGLEQRVLEVKAAVQKLERERDTYIEKSKKFMEQIKTATSS